VESGAAKRDRDSSLGAAKKWHGDGRKKSQSPHPANLLLGFHGKERLDCVTGNIRRKRQETPTDNLKRDAFRPSRLASS